MFEWIDYHKKTCLFSQCCRGSGLGRSGDDDNDVYLDVGHAALMKGSRAAGWRRQKLCEGKLD